MFPGELKPKCLIVLVRGNPYFMQTFTARDRQNLDTIYRLGQNALERLGFQVITMSKDYTADDFVDAGHFMPSGGRKLARKSRSIFKEYLPSPIAPSTARWHRPQCRCSGRRAQA